MKLKNAAVCKFIQPLMLFLGAAFFGCYLTAMAQGASSGTWTDVTPSGIDLNNSSFNHDNFGINDVVVDPVRASDLYAFTCHQGVWKSTDYGQTWSKTSTGTNGSALDAGKLWTAAIDPNPGRNPATPPTLWTATGNAAAGVWKSTDGGVSWVSYPTNNTTAATASGNSYFGNDPYSIDVDPNDSQHLITGFHGYPGISESIDGGKTWTTINVPSNIGASVYPFFVNTGVASTTRTTWLTQSQWVSNTAGIWRTADSGATWSHVGPTYEHKHGGTQIYQAGNGVIYIASVNPNGVFRSTDYGQTWSQVSTVNTNAVFGTPNQIYSQDSFASSGAFYNPNLMSSPFSGTQWSAMTPAPAMSDGAKRAAVTYDGSHYIIVSGNFLAGIWRYVEPSPTGSPIAAVPAFSLATGTYTSTQTVTITSATSGASIRYTTDGSAPSETNGTLYSGPVSISSTTTLKAIAYASGFTDSPVTSRSYTIGAQQSPVISSTGTASGTVGTAFSYQIIASNSPTSYGATGLPAGLSVNTSTGLISGTPSAPGTSSVILSAINASGTGSLTLTLTVNSGGTPAALPQLAVTGGKFVDPTGHTVILRGVSSQGMAQVYGDKSNPGTYLPMTQAQYIDRTIQTDATGNKWYVRAIRLIFERFPCTDSSRLYTVENVPYAMPDTIPFSAWKSAATYSDGGVVASAGSRYRVVKKLWRADRGQAWNPTPYQVGDMVVTVNDDVYRCTSSTGSGTPAGNWGAYPQGTGSAISENEGNLQYVWQWLGRFGLSGSVPPSSLTPVTDNGQKWLVDNLVQWQYMSADYTPAQALANFNDWKSKVMDPAVQHAIDDGLYVVITDFDFGPAQHPLRHARMLDFWKRMAVSQWANHPQVIFELWNESEDIGSYPGGPGSWVLQKPVIQETVDAVRTAGANNIIIIPTPFYSSQAGEAAASPLSGTNLAYAIHTYRSQWEAYSSNRDQINQALASGQAIVFTEWGDDTNPTDPSLAWPVHTTVLPTLRQLLEPSEGSTHPAAGWFAWALTQNWSPDLYSDSALTQPSGFGASVRQWLSDKRNDSQPTPTLPPTATDWDLVGAADFNGDGKPDLIWQNTATGERTIWLMNGTTHVSTVSIGTISTDWDLVGAADFTKDGKPDLILQNTVTGERTIWLMNGTTHVSTVSIATIPIEWDLVGAADFNGDGNSDLIWQDKVTGERAFWLMNGTTPVSSLRLATIPTNWEIVGAADFNGDGKPDLIWQDTTTGQRALWLMNGTTAVSSVSLATISTDWDLVGAADFNGDSKPDLIWQDKVTGQRAIWLMNGTTAVSSVSLGTIP